jgi:hypothetical protein
MRAVVLLTGVLARSIRPLAGTGSVADTLADNPTPRLMSWKNIVITTATGLPSIGGEMEYGHNPWNQHWRQNQHHNQAWKEDRLPAFLPRRGSLHLHF